MASRVYNTAEAARLIGVSKSTLLHWFRTKAVKDVSRSAKGWRIFTEDDIEHLRAFRGSERPPVSAAGGTTSVAERRRWLRFTVRLPVRYEFPQNGSMGPTSGHSETINVGLDGVMLPVDLEWIRLGQINLAITLPEERTSVEVLGEVRWAQHRTGGNLLGVKFIRMRSADRRLISEYISRDRV